MPLKERNNIFIRISLIVVTSLCLLAAGCRTQNKEELSDSEKRIQDSISRIEQSKRVDSMKRKNPLLIMPPDSQYTGSYVDKYSSGITKFVGFYRQGKRHGQWLSFYPNGLAWSEMHYDKGLKQGPNSVYYESGKKRYAGFYKNDKQDSIWTYYDSLGVIIKKVVFENDKLIKELSLK
jgi:antitoxin component YwqK of YwqJK toxin-antitoxin module